MINISHQAKLKNNSESPQIALENGLLLVKLDLSDQTIQEDFIIQQTSLNSLDVLKQSIPKKQFAMQESVPCIKKKILNDKLNSSNQNSQIQLSLKILDQDLTGKEKVLQPFWNPSTMEISKELWSPTKTDCVDLEMNLLNGSSKRLMLNSWFSVNVMKKSTPLENSQKIYLQSLMSSLHETMDLDQDAIKLKEEKKLKNLQQKNQRLLKKIKNETIDEKKIRIEKENIKLEKDIKKKQTKELKKQKAIEKNIPYIDRSLKQPAEKSKNIQVYFSNEQKQILKKWFGVTRFIYNKCLYEFKKSKNQNIKYLREKVINNSNYVKENKWMLDYHYDLRDEALRDLLKNIKSNEAKGIKFEISFKKRKDEYIKGASISILAKYWNVNGFFSKILNPKNIKSNEQLPDILMYSSRLKKTAINKYFISLPLPLDENQINEKEQNIIFIDPGVKCFLTGYDPKGKIIQWGENDIGRIARLLHYKRKIQSSKSSKSINSKKKRKLRIAELRISDKIKNLVLDMHKKLAKWLCENYSKIYIPRLNFHKMKKLNSKEKAKMASLNQCAFVDRLIWKSREFKCKIYEVPEDYTSKTCSNCGSLKTELKGRTYNCKCCNKIFDRDINASKNIMLKYLTEKSS